MLTNPSTLGPFDEGIEEVARIFHDAGALLYYDGANLNAVVGISRPGDMGFDIVHYNCTRRSRSRTVAAAPAEARWRCGTRSSRSSRARLSFATATTYRLDHDRPKSIGRVRGFAGPFGVFVRAYAFMRAYGPGLKEMSEVAVLNANYVLARLKDVYDLPYDRLCMHEFVLSARALKREHGITALDVAKRLHGLRDPPADDLLPARRARGPDDRADRDGAHERLDDFVDAMRAIAEEAATSPEPCMRRRMGARSSAPRRGAGGEAAGRPLPLRRAPRARRRLAEKASRRLRLHVAQQVFEQAPVGAA